MGINLEIKTKSKASLKLFNYINTFIFEQEYGELKDNPKVKSALVKAAKELAKLIKEN